MKELIKLILEEIEKDKTGRVRKAFAELLKEVGPQRILLNAFQNIVDDGNESIRREVIIALKNALPIEGIELFKKMAIKSDEDVEVREEAIKAIGYVATAKEDIEPLQICLKDNNPFIRLGAIFAILYIITKTNVIKTSEVKELLNEVEMDINQFVRRTATFVLTL